MTSQKKQTANPIELRSMTAEEYKKNNGWLIGTLHRASPSNFVKALPSSSEKAPKETK